MNANLHLDARQLDAANASLANAHHGLRAVVSGVPEVTFRSLTNIGASVVAYLTAVKAVGEVLAEHANQALLASSELGRASGAADTSLALVLTGGGSTSPGRTPGVSAQ